MRPIPPPAMDVARRDDLAQAIFLAWVTKEASPEDVLTRAEVVQRQAEAAFTLADQFMVARRSRA